MKVNTNQFGEVEFDDNLIINFTDSIVGFENLNKYVLVNDNNELFLWLMSVDEPEIIFPLFPINALLEDFPFKEKFQTFGIVKLDSDPANITINLKAPVYINQETKKGFQQILDKENLQIDYKLFVQS